MGLSAEFCLLCEAHAESGGRHSLINVFDVINCSRFPAKLRKCFLVARLRGDPGEYQGQLRFVASSSEEDMVPPLPRLKVTVPEGLRPAAFLVCQMSGLPMRREGFYTFSLEFDGEQVASCEIFARLMERK